MLKYDITDEDNRTNMVDEDRKIKEKIYGVLRQKSKEQLKQDQDKS